MSEPAQREKSLGELLKLERERRGWSQADIAHELGTTQQTVGRWEAGQEPQPRFRRRLMDLLQPPAEVYPLRLAPAPPEQSAIPQELLLELVAKLVNDELDDARVALARQALMGLGLKL